MNWTTKPITEYQADGLRHFFQAARLSTSVPLAVSATLPTSESIVKEDWVAVYTEHNFLLAYKQRTATLTGEGALLPHRPEPVGLTPCVADPASLTNAQRYQLSADRLRVDLYHNPNRGLLWQTPQTGFSFGLGLELVSRFIHPAIQHASIICGNALVHVEEPVALSLASTLICGNAQIRLYPAHNAKTRTTTKGNKFSEGFYGLQITSSIIGGHAFIMGDGLAGRIIRSSYIYGNAVVNIKNSRNRRGLTVAGMTIIDHGTFDTSDIASWQPDEGACGYSIFRNGKEIQKALVLSDGDHAYFNRHFGQLEWELRDEVRGTRLGHNGSILLTHGAWRYIHAEPRRKRYVSPWRYRAAPSDLRVQARIGGLRGRAAVFQPIASPASPASGCYMAGSMASFAPHLPGPLAWPTPIAQPLSTSRNECNVLFTPTTDWENGPPIVECMDVRADDE